MDNLMENGWGLPVIAEDLCDGCLHCIDICPKKVLVPQYTWDPRRSHNVPVYKGKGCDGCGLCFFNCSRPGAVTVYKRFGALVSGVHASVV